MENIYSMPCLYGVCFYYKKNSACAYVDEKGKTNLVSKKNKVKLINHNYIFLRGLEFFIFGLYYFVINMVKMPYVYGNKSISNKLSKNLNVGTRQTLTVLIILIAVAIAFLMFGFIPVKIAVLISNYSKSLFLNKLIVGLIKIALLYIVLLILKLFIPFKQFYRFNACSNSLTNDKDIHKPTNFLNYVVFSFCVSFFVLALVGFTSNTIWKPVINLIISVFCFSICYEILLFLEKSKQNWVNKLCIVTSFLITEKPTKTELYIAMSAYNEVVFMQDKKRGIVNSEQFKDNETSFSSIYAESKEKLKNAGICDTSEVDWLICEVLGISRGQIRLQTKITQDQRKQIESAINKRVKGEPITKIFGRTQFYGYDFKVTKDVLSPRMETEILVENALKYAKEKMNILDMCTGSGIIAISMAKNINANFTAVDISEKALAVAQENANKNNVKITFKLSNLFENLKKVKKFDIIISNPPYIQTQDIEKLDIEVKDYDPKIALDGGEDGLEFYKKIIQQSPAYLTKGGYLMFELGIGQKQDVENLLKQDFEQIKVIKDYNKINRVIIAKLKEKKE